MAECGPFVLCAIALCFIGSSQSANPYLGKFLGKLSELHHGVSGEVYAVDGRTLHIKDFTYDGQGPGAFFYASTQKSADKNGFRLRDENGKGDVIRRYRKEGITLTLPDGKNLNNIKIFYVWCEDFDVNFGHVNIARGFDYPRPLKLDALKGVHGISSDNIVIVDAQTLLVPNLSYDGEAPDAKFWVGHGSKPSPQGIRVPDENGKEVPLRRYDRKTVVLTLPGDLTVFDIGHFGIWCEQFTVDFGHVLIPQGLNIPPSLRMLGVSPQSKLNCEVLYDDLAFEVRWAVAGESIVLQLVAKLDDRQYMSFGLSGKDSRSVMIDGDVVVAWIDKESLKGYAEDYYLADKSQCSGPSGSCPDNRLAENTNSVRLLNAATVNGYSIVTYQRPLRASDAYDRHIRTNVSQPIIWAVGPLNQRDEVSFHSNYLKEDKLLNFGRPARWNCPMPEGEQPTMALLETRAKMQVVDEASTGEEISAVEVTSSPKRNNGRRRGSNRGTVRPQLEQSEDSENSASRTKEQSQQHKRGSQRGNGGSSRETSNAVRVPPPTLVKKGDPWDIPAIQCYEPDDGVFYAQMGPTGGKRGYSAITGHVGWGISWYINGLLIPEINLVRGKTYTFVVEGGLDPEVSAKYHPFYITDDPVGGYEYKTPEEKRSIKIFAGVQKSQDGTLIPTGIGRLCHWTQTGDLEADEFQSFGGYQRTLELKCDQGEPGVLQWTPDENTPDTVYYQCFTHRYLGWKIHVHDSCDSASAASKPNPSIVAPPQNFQDKSDTDLEDSPSIRVETRVKPNNIINKDREDKEHKSTVSEKGIIPSTIDPNQTTGQLPNEPILTQPQQSFFEPYYQWNGPQYALHSFNFHQQQQHPLYFRPSTPLNLTYEVTTLAELPSISTTSTTLFTSTTTTATSMPKINDNIAVASHTANETIISPPLPKLPNMNVVFRRPLAPSPNYHTRLVSQSFPRKFRQPNLPSLRPYSVQKFPVKKHMPRPPIKLFIPNNHPYQFEFESSKIPTNSPVRLSLPQFIVTQSTAGITRSPPIQTMTENPKLSSSQVINVEISPQQSSTEREPEIQTAPSTSFVDITPTFVHPAYNTGFKPGSIKIESGFKPIISRELQDRIDQNEPEIEYEGEKGVVNIKSKEKYNRIHIFEPMFVPSPTDKPVKNKQTKIKKRQLTKKRYQYTKIVVKHQRNLKDSLEEPIAEAAERVDTYYLPPDNQRQKPVSIVQEPSNIDIEAIDDSNIKVDSPPDVVVTYDGKRVSGQSLTARLSDRSSILDQRLSKASSFIRARPQFVQFRGELPPLNLDYINKNAPQLQSRAGVLSRSLDTPSLPADVPQDSTRLSRIAHFQKRNMRTKRDAHHTPEHTAQQEENKINGTKVTNSANCHFSSLHSGIIVVVSLFKYVCFFKLNTILLQY